MYALNFFQDKTFLSTEYDGTRWIKNSGLSQDELKTGFDKLIELNKNDSTILLRAKIFEYIFSHAQIGFDKHDIFFDQVDGDGIMEMESVQRSYLKVVLYIVVGVTIQNLSLFNQNLHFTNINVILVKTVSAFAPIKLILLLMNIMRSIEIGVILVGYALKPATPML